MAKGFKHGAGGGGNPLNFSVVGNPQPASPKENTIWLNTDVPIGLWFFSATQPELSEGDVWFPTGTSSSVEFSATKKNPVMVYPISAKQMVDNGLVDVTAKSYQGGEWVDWTITLVPNSYYTWEVVNIGTITVNADNSITYIVPFSGVHGISCIPEQIDLSNYSSATFKITRTGTNRSCRVGFMPLKSAGINDFSAYAEFGSSALLDKTEFTVDISNISYGYIGVAGNDETIVIYEIKLIP